MAQEVAGSQFEAFFAHTIKKAGKIDNQGVGAAAAALTE